MTEDASGRMSKADRAATIKASAVEVFAEHGYQAAKVSMIVQKAGVAQGTFYLYYASKQEIFGQILQDFLMLVHETIADWDVGKLQTVEEYSETLADLGCRLTDVIVANRDLARIFFNEAQMAPEFAGQITEFYQALTALMTGFNRTMHRSGLIRSMNHEMLALSTIGTVERCVQHYIIAADPVPPRDELVKIVDEMIAQFMFGAACHSGVPKG